MHHLSLHWTRPKSIYLSFCWWDPQNHHLSLHWTRPKSIYLLFCWWDPQNQIPYNMWYVQCYLHEFNVGYVINNIFWKSNVALKTVLMIIDVLYSTILVVISLPRFQNTFLATTIQTLVCYLFLLKSLVMNAILSGKRAKPKPLSLWTSTKVTDHNLLLYIVYNFCFSVFYLATPYHVISYVLPLIILQHIRHSVNSWVVLINLMKTVLASRNIVHSSLFTFSALRT